MSKFLRRSMPSLVMAMSLCCSSTYAMYGGDGIFRYDEVGCVHTPLSVSRLASAYLIEEQLPPDASERSVGGQAVVEQPQVELPSVEQAPLSEELSDRQVDGESSAKVSLGDQLFGEQEKGNEQREAPRSDTFISSGSKEIAIVKPKDFAEKKVMPPYTRLLDVMILGEDIELNHRTKSAICALGDPIDDFQGVDLTSGRARELGLSKEGTIITKTDMDHPYCFAINCTIAETEDSESVKSSHYVLCPFVIKSGENIEARLNHLWNKIREKNKYCGIQFVPVKSSGMSDDEFEECCRKINSHCRHLQNGTFLKNEGLIVTDAVQSVWYMEIKNEDVLDLKFFLSDINQWGRDRIKDAAIKEINILLNNVLADIIAHDKSAKVAKESARKTDEMDGRMTFCEREVVAIRHGMEQLTARVDGHDEVLEDIQSRLDQLDKRMMDFERIENALFERVGEIATVMWNELSKTGKVDEKKFDELVSTLDHLTNELAANRDLGERFVELSSRVTKIGTYARVVSERMDTAVGRLDDVQSAVHRHSDRMQALERQRGEMQNALERVITDVRGVTGDYREYVDRCVKNQLEARKQKLRDVYDRAWWLQRSRMEDVHPDLFDGEEK